MKKIITLIVVANGTRASFYFNNGPNRGLKVRPDLDMEGENLHARDIQADEPGRAFDRSGKGRHAMEYPNDPQRLIERKFLGDVVDRLNKLSQKPSFDRLVLVAPPRALGDLRKLLSKALSRKVYSEINKDLTHIAQHDLSGHFDDVIVL